jgi:hypothetical protein
MLRRTTLLSSAPRHSRRLRSRRAAGRAADAHRAGGQPTAARAIGLALPQSLVLRAEHVIE